ncbi:sulfotransferase [uncultured Winogradskyella sp.]|uniref:sulfotransferase n=1 Tax=uncultured Winogradskyella sp. TaxID=395353 RepID=UPI0026110913|nr:sulfotransferase [uncultured Winogradskyella sp.]
MKRKLIVRRTINKVRYWKKLLVLLFSKSRYGPKIFCIGYNKTGTTTLGKSLKMLGYKHSSFDRKIYRKYYLKSKYNKIIDYTSKFESFDDLPWLKEDMIPVLDKAFPGSKFIYLTREEHAWKKSFYKWTYKTKGAYPDVEEGWEAYKKHEAFVLDYFKAHPKDQFIVLDVKDKTGFEKLALFLGKTPIQANFPHFNQTSKY